MYTKQGLTRLLFCILLLLHPVSGFAKDKLPKGVIELNGMHAPALVLQDMDANTYDLSKSRGRWVFVHFWASWCGPCRRELPTIQSIHSKFNPSKLEIVLVNTAESEDTVFAIIGELAPDLNPLLDLDGLVTERWQPRGLPATYFVDPSGKLRYVALGGRPWDKPDYLNFLQTLIK